ncbi:hypothetical protein M378DRAFT_26805 [Amanita muscaria Koide BX008]|uniref:Uncharacterized protein n=1 Tax=Amanita muscaria (strain Koide BX008) TaxID=946122 RepID=A0A0C2T051_AMAMK|nr:hypothetical protein M378DRAFT_26805 [Amanita muscaria Koide BX008]
MKGIYKDYFPIVWKRSTFPTAGDYVLTATYKNQLVFVKPEVDNDTLTFPETWININLGQQTELIEDSDSATISFTNPTSGAGDKYIKVINKTPTPQTIGVGFDNGSSLPHILLVFDEIGSMYNVTAQFNPTLKAYITEDYQENSVLRGAIQTPVVWKQNLAALEETSNWKLERDPVSGQYSITTA